MTKRAFAGLLLPVLLLAGCTTPVEQGADTSAPRVSATPDIKHVLVAGDSLSGGFDATTRDQGFVALVMDELAPAKLHRAERAHQTLSTVSGITDVPEGVDIAVIELGTNDVGVETPDAEFRETYESLLGRITAASPEVQLVCVGTWTGWGWTQDQIIQDSCRDAGGSYVHLRDVFEDPSTRGPAGEDTHRGPSDDFHPNNTGHERIAARILDALDN
ncbi:MAG: SGNH/GDSL hydrolase family protein [Microbacterium sp.]